MTEAYLPRLRPEPIEVLLTHKTRNVGLNAIFGHAVAAKTGEKLIFSHTAPTDWQHAPDNTPMVVVATEGGYIRDILEIGL